MGLIDHVADFFERHALADRPGVIAISGGPDSVALAHVCVTLHRQLRLAPIALAHLNHQLRGPDSDADEEFVRGLPAAWNEPTLAGSTHRIDVAELARKTGDNLENAARQARYDWLSSIAQQRNASWVATGHSADDQAETVLHHFLRGSGLQGLAGMSERRPLAPGIDLIRPLLLIRRAYIMAYLQEHGLMFRTDASNEDLTLTRNRLRRQLLPMLERDFNPKLTDVLGRTAAHLQQVQDDLAVRAAELLRTAERPRAGNIVVLLRTALSNASPLLLREALRLIWKREGWPMGEMGFAEWERAAALAQGQPAGQDFPGGVRMRTAAQVIQLERCIGK